MLRHPPSRLLRAGSHGPCPKAGTDRRIQGLSKPPPASRTPPQAPLQPVPQPLFLLLLAGLKRRLRVGVPVSLDCSGDQSSKLVGGERLDLHGGVWVAADAREALRVACLLRHGLKPEPREMLRQDGDALSLKPNVRVEPVEKAAQVLAQRTEQMHAAGVEVADVQEPHRPLAAGDLLRKVMLGGDAVEAAASRSPAHRTDRHARKLGHHAASLAAHDGVEWLADLAIEELIIEAPLDVRQEVIDPGEVEGVLPRHAVVADRVEVDHPTAAGIADQVNEALVGQVGFSSLSPVPTSR